MESEQLAAAMRYWEAGDLGAAAVLFRENAATSDPEASHLLACLLEEQGDLDGAEAAHRSVIQSGDPVFGQRSAIAMSMMLIAAREWPAAYRVLMIASDGADFEVAALAETALVLVLTEMGDAQGAAEALERARRCDSPAVAELAAQLELPDFVPHDPGTARDLYELAEDEDDYQQLLTCGDPEVVSLSAFRLFQMYADEEDFAAAREVCEYAIAVGHPDHLATAHRLRGAVLVDLGEYAEAAASYATAAEDPRPEERLPALIEQAKVTAQLGDVVATKAIFHRVIASGQREYAVEAQACLAQMHTEAGEVAAALAALRAVLEAGESEWSSICVTLLGLLLDRHPDERESLMALVLDAAEHDDPDTAFKAALLIDHAARQQPLADPVEEQALLDVDEALRHLQAGDLAVARRLLRRAIDSGAATQSVRAMMTLAELELGEGDREQADELLSYVAEGDDLLQGFSAEFFLHLLRESGGEPHPVLRAVIDHQRLGREEGLVRYRQAMEHPNPATAAIGTAVFAQVLASIGYDLSDAAQLFRAAAESGDPLALSYTATIFKDVLVNQDQTEEAVTLLRRARADGHPGLAPWVAYGLGELLSERAGDDLGFGAGEGAGALGGAGVRGAGARDLVEARAAFAAAMETGHRGLRVEAMGALLGLFERQGDLLAACRLHERFVAEGDPVQAPRNAWLLGLTRVRIDDLDGARAAFAHIPETHPEEGDTGRYARFLLDRDFGAAAAAFQEIADDGRTWMAAMLAMQSSHAWHRQGETAAADGALSLVLDVGDPDFRQEAACYLGALRHDAGDPHGAIAAWRQATTGPDERLTTIAHRDLARTWHTLGDLDAAAQAYRKVLAGCGGVAKAHQGAVVAGRVAEDQGAAPGAETAYDGVAVAEAAFVAEACQGMAGLDEGRTYQGMVTGVNEAPAYQGMVAAAGEAPVYRGSVAGVDKAYEAEMYQGMVAAAGEAPVYQGSVTGVDKAYVAEAYQGMVGGAGEADAGEAYREAVVEAHVAEAALRLGEILIATGSTDEAREVLRVVFGDAAVPQLARLLRDAGDLEGALAAAEIAVGIAPGAEVVCLLGGLLARTGDMEGALAAFERAVAADPASAGATLVEAGRRLEEAGDQDGARSAYQRAAAQDLDRQAAATARVRLGTASPKERPWVLAAEGDRQGALAALTELTGSALMARLLLALDAGEPTEVCRLLTASPTAGKPNSSPAERSGFSVVGQFAPSTADTLAEVSEASVAEACGFPVDEAFAETLEMARTTRDDAFARALYLLVIELGGPRWAAMARLGLGAELARDGQYSQAELCLLPATESDDADISLMAWRDVSAVRRRCGDLDGAVEALRAAMPSTAVELAGLLEEGGDLAGAGDVLDRGAAAGDLASLRHLLVNLFQRREYAAVAAEAELAVGTGDPETVAMGYWVWGDACKATDDLAGAVAMYRKGIDTGHPSAGMRVDLADALHSLGDTAAAAGEARLAIESGEADAVARGGLQLGCWLHEDGDPLGAAEAFAAAAGTSAAGTAAQLTHETAHELAQIALNNLSTLAYQAYEQGEHALAVQVLSHLGPHAGTKARELAELCDDPDAVHLYYELVGSDAFTELGVAERLAELGETARARAIYERLNEHEDPDVRFVAGGRLLALLDVENDVAAFYNLAERQAGDADSPVRSVFGSLLGMLQGRQGDTEASLRTLREAAESGEPTALSVLAQALVGTGEVAEGREVYRRVLSAGDDELAARAMVALGHSYHDEDEDEARRWYVRAVEFGTGHVTALGAMYLGALAKRERDFPEALGWYQRVIDSGDTESGMAAAHLGELCYWLNDRDGAVRYYELTLGLTEQPDLVAEAAFRLGEIRYAHGDLTVARRMLRLAAGTDDSTFAADAEQLLAKLG
ncbi:tetratricopeptide repeat protein [Nonomuraea guangzhouensis]|uniref:tetratricopeptide repeat protein n=1 Tax=Nonomuraea guangzhouensis TaxID=1291555 RepID=UPI001C5EF276|nr:tetratricopeptide repeat protein [Nonomuraea guangzhouensis]